MDERDFFQDPELREDSPPVEGTIPIEVIRRKSCECEKCGMFTPFQKKAGLVQVVFQTKYNIEKAERLRALELEREKMKSTIISSFFNYFMYILITFNRTHEKASTKHQKRKPHFIVLF